MTKTVKNSYNYFLKKGTLRTRNIIVDDDLTPMFKVG